MIRYLASGKFSVLVLALNDRDDNICFIFAVWYGRAKTNNGSKI